MDNMQLWLSSSTDSINLNDSAEGFYLNPDLEGLTGLPEIRSVNGLNAGYDGGWTATQLWAARLITIRGVIAINDKAAVEDKRKALAKILSQGKDEDLELKFVSEVGNTYATTVRTSYCTMALQRVFWRQEYQIQLRANDPLIYDDGGSELIAILRVMAGEGGFEIPFDIPFDIGGSITPTSIDVGDEATYPLIRLKGDLHSPTIINMTTNQRMQVLADIITTVEWHDYTTTYTTNGFTQIGDGIDGAPLSLTHLYGNTTQHTTTGKNLFNKNASPAQTGLATKTVLPTGVRITSTTAGSFRWLIWTVLDTNDYVGKTITLSAVATPSSTNNPRILFGLCDSSGGNRSPKESMDSTGQMTISHTISSVDATRPYLYIGLYATGSVDSASGVYIDYTNLQVEVGSTPTSYEEYTAGPSPNPSYPQTVNVVTGAQTVKITGKNLFNNGATPITAAANTTVSELSTGIRVKTTDNATFRYVQYGLGDMSSFAGKNVVVYAKITPNATNNGRVALGLCKSDYSDRVGKILLNATGSTYFALNADELAERPYMYAYAYGNLDSATSQANDYVDYTDFQIEISTGTTPSQYEPYGQSQEINLGKNLIPFTNQDFTVNGVRYYVQNGALYLDGTCTGETLTSHTQFKNNFSFTLEAGTYTFSMGTDGTLRPMSVKKYSDDSNISSLSSVQMQTTFTLSEQTQVYIGFYLVSSNSYSNTKYEVQIERGTIKTDFAPYKTPIELAKIGNYTDYIWNDDGTWKIHKATGKVIYKGVNEGWSLSATYTKCARFTSNKITASSATMAIMSDHFTQGVGGSDTENIAVNGGTRQIMLTIDKTVASTHQELQTWLGNNNTTVYYALATPTDTEITDADLIEQLNFVASLYEGVNNLMLIPSAEPQGEIEVSYATAEDIDYHEVVIDCQARTVTQDGHNLYPALADGSEFIRLLPGENKLYLTSEVESDNGTAEVKFKKGNISI